jgi:putative SOS response-associated peptidase YedK
MSERLVIPDRADVETEVSVDHPWWQFSLRYNVAASHSVPVARMHGRESEGVMMRWGLVPASAKGDVRRRGPARIYADCVSSGDFRTAWVHGQRCIVPLAGFYIWQQTAAGHRQPYYVRLVNRLVFGVAALWERSVSDDDEVVESCALLTVRANTLLGEIDSASDQMPAILHRDDYDAWLRSRVADARELLVSYPQNRMVCHPVGPYVNDPALDGPQLIRRVDATALPDGARSRSAAPVHRDSP